MSKRRARGEGSLYKREDGSWVAQLYLPSGKKKVKYGKTQREVREWLQKQQEAVSKGVLIESKEITLEAFLKQYMDSAENTLRPKTLESYHYLINKHIVPTRCKVFTTKKSAAGSPNELYSICTRSSIRLWSRP
jgi:integrase